MGSELLIRFTENFMKKNYFYALLLTILPISHVFAKTPNLNSSCESNAAELSFGGSPVSENHLSLFSVYLEETDEDLSLRLDCNKMKLIVVSEFYGSNESEDVTKISSKNINFQYDQTTKKVSFNIFNQKVIATLNSGDLVFEEKVGVEVGKEVNDEIVRHEYKDKIVVIKDYFDGLISLDIRRNGHSLDYTVRDVSFKLTNLLYPKVYFLNNNNVGDHYVSYGQQADYKEVLKELSSL